MSLCKTVRQLGTTICLLSILVAPAFTTAAEQTSEVIFSSQWPQYVNGSNLLKLPQIHSILKQFDEHEKVDVLIQYPGGDAGRQWGESLFGWLVSFGIPGKYIQFQPGAGASDQLVIIITDRR